MQKKSIKNFACIFAFFIFSSGCFATDWPQQIESLNEIFTYFTNQRGGVFSSGLVFYQNQQIVASETGKIVINLSESQNNCSFDTPLGNSIITLNDDNLMSVYGNLSKAGDSEKISIKEGEIIGESGKSGWHKQNAGLEYQVADCKSKTLINPLILLPAKDEYPHFVMRNLTVVNKKGNSYRLSKAKSIPSGTYSLYFEQNEHQAPFRLAVLLNGKEIENITYNMLKKNGSQLAVDGKNNYYYSTIFPGLNRQLLANITFNRGKALLVVQSTDLKGNERNFSYSIDVN